MPYSDTIGGSISATSTKTTTDLNGCLHLTLINDGANSVHVVLVQDSPEDTTVDTTDFELKINETITFDSTEGFINLLTICDTAETATVRYIGWY